VRVEKMAALAEIVSSIAIVLTLIYLAMQTQQLATQTQQTKDALYATSRQATMTADVSIILSALDPPIAELELIPYEDMTDLQRQLRGNLFAALSRVREFAWLQYQNGILDQATLESYLAPLRRFIRRPGGAEEWEATSAELDPSFVEFVDQYLER